MCPGTAKCTVEYITIYLVETQYITRHCRSHCIICVETPLLLNMYIHFNFFVTLLAHLHGPCGLCVNVNKGSTGCWLSGEWNLGKRTRVRYGRGVSVRHSKMHVTQRARKV